MNRIILDITPQTWFKVLPEHTLYFVIPEFECPKGKLIKKTGKMSGCIDFKKTGNCSHLLQKYGKRVKKRINQYNKYKIDVLALAKAKNFKLPQYGFALYFYYPVPTSWPKYKKEAFHGQPKLSKPDIDNLEKAFYDSLSTTDEEVGQVSGHGKFWDNKITKGYIEILLDQPVYNPFGVQFIDQREFNNRPKRTWVRRNESKPVFSMKNDIIK